MIEEDLKLEDLSSEELKLFKKGLIGRETSRRFWQNKQFSIDTQINIKNFINNTLDIGYCNGYNTVLQAYEELFGLDERYWKLVNYLEKIN